MSELHELARHLVAIDSVNPDLVPGGAAEGKIAYFVSDWLESAGLDVELDEAAPGRPNVVAIARGSGGGRSLMLNGHTDTVGASGMKSYHSPCFEDGRLYGRGAYDMKGALAACMVAAAEARKRRLRGDVIVAAVADEEYASIGTASVLKRWRTDAAVVAEATHLKVCVAHKGFIWLEVETKGVAAHGSRPDLGVDAITKMGRVLVGLDELNHKLHANPIHPLLASGSLHASLIGGGQELSSYPESCTLSIERRTIPGETPGQVEDEVREILDRIGAADPEFRATVRTTLVRNPFEVSPVELIVQALCGEAHRIMGVEPDLVGGTMWMDSALLSAAGIPTVVFGPSGGGAHAAVEWVDLDSMDKCAQVLLATATRFCE